MITVTIGGGIFSQNIRALRHALLNFVNFERFISTVLFQIMTTVKSRSRAAVMSNIDEPGEPRVSKETPWLRRWRGFCD